MVGRDLLEPAPPLAVHTTVTNVDDIGRRRPHDGGDQCGPHSSQLGVLLRLEANTPIRLFDTPPEFVEASVFSSL